MIVVVAVGVSDADEIEPILSHMFAISGFCEELLDEVLVSLGRGVGEELLNFPKSRR